ncbi:hypothetical protein EMIHUDRAFT_457941, partial [Emiliania huxleyi CCMP1516]|uniref:PH domain-containing protein n=2 Tax=Emiliania huxleyi TaxID=2903 RepID=A0A0D3JJE8_EMIH1
MRNLDTGEAVVLDVPRGRAEEEEGRERASAALSSLITNSGEWEAIKREARGVLEKLASAKTLSFRSYQLCVWQERWVYAADDALCYQHLNSEVEPIGAAKRIPYSSVEFVGPFDETQFVIKCAGRAFTFLCETGDEGGGRGVSVEMDALDDVRCVLGSWARGEYVRRLSYVRCRIALHWFTRLGVRSLAI